MNGIVTGQQLPYIVAEEQIGKQMRQLVGRILYALAVASVAAVLVATISRPPHPHPHPVGCGLSTVLQLALLPL